MAHLKTDMHIKSLILKKKAFSLLERKFPILGKQCNPNNVIQKFLETEFHNIAETYSRGQLDIHSTKDFHSDENTIWIFWWQGYDRAPPLVQKCIDSVRAHSNGNTVVIITKENYNDYTDLPSYIIEKVKGRKITLTHFSDILRMALITAHGGLWLDATIFVSKDIPATPPPVTLRFDIRHLQAKYLKADGRDFAKADSKIVPFKNFALMSFFHIGKNSTFLLITF